MSGSTGAIRGDDNSAFGEDFSAAYYPKLSASWVISEEPWFSVGPNDIFPEEFDKFVFREINEAVMRKLRIEDPGDTGLTTGALVDREEVKEKNALAEAEGKKSAKTKKGKPASGKTLLLGITKASLQAESFLSGASFQETTKVLTEASLKGATDTLIGLKENVLLGHLIPAGTGFRPYQEIKVKLLAEPPAEESLDDEELLEEAETATAVALGEATPLAAPQVQFPTAAVTNPTGIVNN